MIIDKYLSTQVLFTYTNNLKQSINLSLKSQITLYISIVVIRNLNSNIVVFADKTYSYKLSSTVLLVF